MVIRVDGGGGVKQYESRDSQFLTLDVDPNSLMVGAFVVRAVDISQDFQGMCQHILYVASDRDDIFITFKTYIIM